MPKEFREKTITICSIVRNAEKGLIKNIPVINQICSLFKDYRIVVYENNSTDKTKFLLSQWKESLGNKAYFVMEDVDFERTIPKANSVACNPFFSRKRISKMAFLRNLYMNVIDQLGWTADYLMVVDLDVTQLYFESILSSFNTKMEWDAVTANGYSMGPNLRRRYHDTYALTECGDENTPQTEEKIRLLANKYGTIEPGDEWVRVYSAFGGLAIYKFEAIKGLRYQVLDNNDNRVEVRCEHYSIYKQMAERGYDKVFINPSMNLKYQDLNFRIVWNTVVRKVKSFFLQVLLVYCSIPWH